MGDLVKINTNGLVNLLHNTSALTDFKPFEREIFLFDTYIAGTTHIKNIDEIEKEIVEGVKLDFFREPDNVYDSKAIVIKTVNGEKVGYVPRQDNIIFSRLMDAGKLLFGKVSSKEKKGKWVKVYIKVYLKE